MNKYCFDSFVFDSFVFDNMCMDMDTCFINQMMLFSINSHILFETLPRIPHPINDCKNIVESDRYVKSKVFDDAIEMNRLFFVNESIKSYFDGVDKRYIIDSFSQFDK